MEVALLEKGTKTNQYFRSKAWHPSPYKGFFPRNCCVLRCFPHSLCQRDVTVSPVRPLSQENQPNRVAQAVYDEYSYRPSRAILDNNRDGSSADTGALFTRCVWSNPSLSSVIEAFLKIEAWRHKSDRSLNQRHRNV